MSARKLTDQQIAKATELRERGLSVRRIAALIGGISEGALNWHFLKAGVESPRTSKGQFRATTTPGAVEGRGAAVIRRYSEAEDQKLLELAAQGLSHSEIGRRLDPPRRPNSVAGRLLTLARRDARAEERGSG